jgi:hypothetical protein
MIAREARHGTNHASRLLTKQSPDYKVHVWNLVFKRDWFAV